VYLEYDSIAEHLVPVVRAGLDAGVVCGMVVRAGLDAGVVCGMAPSRRQNVAERCVVELERSSTQAPSHKDESTT
jgi:hypothetical protein